MKIGAAGGQSGHPHHERPTPDPDHIDAVRDHFPSQCPSCQTDLADRQQDTCAVQIQFEWELPEVRPFIIAHQYHTVCCRAVAAWSRPSDRPAVAAGITRFVVRICDVSVKRHRHVEH